MRVITGTARGMKLATLEGNDVRPTSDKAKCALFNAIQFDIEAARVLDIFAGSGQLGIEALSRGAKSCDFVDISRETLAMVRQNLEKTGFLKNSRVITADALRFLSESDKKYDIIIADPPYRKGLADQLIEPAYALLAPGGLLAVETEKKFKPTVLTDVPCKCYTHGAASLWIFRKGE